MSQELQFYRILVVIKKDCPRDDGNSWCYCKWSQSIAQMEVVTISMVFPFQ